MVNSSTIDISRITNNAKNSFVETSEESVQMSTRKALEWRNEEQNVGGEWNRFSGKIITAHT